MATKRAARIRVELEWTPGGPNIQMSIMAGRVHTYSPSPPWESAVSQQVAALIMRGFSTVTIEVRETPHLTPKQREILAYACDKGSVPSGRYGYKLNQVLALEKLGLVRPGKAGAFDQDFPLTAMGTVIAKDCAAAHRAALSHPL